MTGRSTPNVIGPGTCSWQHEFHRPANSPGERERVGLRANSVQGRPVRRIRRRRHNTIGTGARKSAAPASQTVRATFSPEADADLMVEGRPVNRAGSSGGRRTPGRSRCRGDAGLRDGKVDGGVRAGDQQERERDERRERGRKKEVAHRRTRV